MMHPVLFICVAGCSYLKYYEVAILQIDFILVFVPLELFLLKSDGENAMGSA